MPDFCSFSLSIDYETSICLSSKTEIAKRLATDSNPLIIDKQVFDLHSDLLNQSPPLHLLLLTAGEDSKSLEQVNHIYEFLLNCKADRSTIITVIGGGTITDASAYAVSTFKRGCRLTLIPSTLLGMIDASLGGKTAVNYNSAKNTIGTFYPAEQVIIVPELLTTLSEKELSNGMAEMLKLQFILPELPEPITSGSIYPQPEVIFEYAKAKLSICTQDLDDKGKRRLLNLGHTFGHALESYTDFTISHGKAIAWGIATAARVSYKLGYIDTDVCSKVVSKLKQYGFMTELDDSLKSGFIAAFPTLVAHDKKNEAGFLTLILFSGTGQVDMFKHIDIQTITLTNPF